MFHGNPPEVEVDQDDNVEVEVGALDSGLEVRALESEFEEWALVGAGASASGSGARVDPICPMTPATFPVLAPNPLFKKDGLKVTWSSDPFQTDTAKATAAAKKFIKEWKAHPNLGYFPQPNSPAYDLQTFGQRPLILQLLVPAKRTKIGAQRKRRGVLDLKQRSLRTTLMACNRHMKKYELFTCWCDCLNQCNFMG